MSWLSGLLAGKTGQEYSCGPALACARAEPAPEEEAIAGVRQPAARTIAPANTERRDERTRRQRLTAYRLGDRPGAYEGAGRTSEPVPARAALRRDCRSCR